MATAEIERRFLLDPAPDPGHPLLSHAACSRIDQTYLAGGDERVRLIRDDRGAERYVHTRKERISNLTRMEEEQEISRVFRQANKRFAYAELHRWAEPDIAQTASRSPRIWSSHATVVV
jgi:hypothetical protein